MNRWRVSRKDCPCLPSVREAEGGFVEEVEEEEEERGRVEEEGVSTSMWYV